MAITKIFEGATEPVVLFCFALLVACLCLFVGLKVVYPNSPPGPPRRLISGNAYQLPKEQPWRTYAAWGQTYGSIISFRTYLRRFIVLNTAESALALLEKRSSIYSDRPMSWMLFKLCGRGQTVFNISASEPRHRVYRRMLHIGLNASAIKGYWPLMQQETRSLVKEFLERPELYEEHIRKNAAAVIMMVAYGYSVKDLEDIFIEHAKETSQITGRAMAPGRWLVDSFPLLRFVPSWLPGAGFKRQAVEWRARFDYLSSVPHAWVKSQVAEGKALPSFTSKLLYRENGMPLSAEEEDIVQWCASGLYAGAADTTVSALISFIMLMALYPEVQSRAQAEVDQRIGGGDLPDFDHLDDLPYVTAVLKEVMRYAPVGPLALPHKATKYDEYEGYQIDKDTSVIANVWAILHDPLTYPNPFAFTPERFLNHYTTTDMDHKYQSKTPQTQPDPRRFAFGFGARVCPGLQFAEKSLLLSMCGLLLSCNIAKAKGVSTTPDNVEFTTGITSHVKPFGVTISAR